MYIYTYINTYILWSQSHDFELVRITTHKDIYTHKHIHAYIHVIDDNFTILGWCGRPSLPYQVSSCHHMSINIHMFLMPCKLQNAPTVDPHCLLLVYFMCEFHTKEDIWDGMIAMCFEKKYQDMCASAYFELMKVIMCIFTRIGCIRALSWSHEGDYLRMCMITRIGCIRACSWSHEGDCVHVYMSTSSCNSFSQAQRDDQEHGWLLGRRNSRIPVWVEKILSACMLVVLHHATSCGTVHCFWRVTCVEPYVHECVA